MAFKVGDLVEADGAFSGVGKIVSLDEVSGSSIVAFFESPIQCNARKTSVKLSRLRLATLFDETNVYLLDDKTGIWRRARYGSRRPDGNHLVIFSRNDTAHVPVAEIFVLNLPNGKALSPIDFLETRSCDTPHFTEWRLPFFRSYIEQRAACKSISSILSSSVEIEPHQIAVVRRVLADTVRKYLLADEVGLGKTIEACLIIREHVLQDEDDALVLVSVPRELVAQWRTELTDRFYLGDLLDERIFVLPHDKLVGALEMATPTMIVIDEAHQVAPWAWAGDSNQRSAFFRIAEGTARAESCLLLSGTPLSGNEANFLAMLHLLAPESYQLGEAGVRKFKKRLLQRELLGGMYQALVPSNDNESLSDIVEQILSMFPDDSALKSLVTPVKPLIDWKAPEDGEQRAQRIRQLRHYLGESYRLHQRMLRNRREDAAIKDLFPGMAGASVCRWEVDKQSLSIDQLLDAYRDENFDRPETLNVLTIENFVDWIELYLTSPALVSRRAQQFLEVDKDRLLPEEVTLLGELVHGGNVEQAAKDKKLEDALSRWLREHPKGKAIVFCGDPNQADAVYEILSALVGPSVERHRPPQTPSFQADAGIRVLVCDRRGEDGLNLHGGEKLIVHYCVPLSFSRIEQRNGRANRYSAGIHARPVTSLVMAPDREAFYNHWVKLLDRAVRIFEKSVASLQYVLQEQLDATMARVAREGVGPLIELERLLIGPNGLLAQERQRVDAQEQLNSMNEEVEDANSFADELQLADENAEAQSQQMLHWICRALQFARTPSDIPGTFRFRYSNGGARGPRTLVDVRTFVSKCVTGIDREESDWSAPVTAVMSPDRQLVTHGRQVYPMRFGQPFVDTIFDLSRADTRGICTAWLRGVLSSRISDPVAYFELTWLIDGCTDGCAPRERRIADERIRPRVFTHWLDAKGEQVEERWVLDLLSAPYRKETSRTAQDVTYRDVRLRHDTWITLEEYFPKDEWPKMVRGVYEASLIAARSNGSGYSAETDEEIVAHLEAVSAVILLRSGV